METRFIAERLKAAFFHQYFIVLTVTLTLHRRVATRGFPQGLGNSLEEDVYFNLLLTFLFVKPQLFSSTVSIKQVLTFLRS